VDTAIQNNLTLQQSQVQVELNKVAHHQSRNNLLPAITGSASQNFNNGRSLNPVSYQYTTGNIRTNNFSVTANLLLFNGFQNQNTIKQNKLAFDASYYDVENTKNDITIQVINAYLQILFSQEQLRNSQNQVDATASQLEQTQHFVNVGKKAEGDLLQLRSQLASDKLTLVNVKGQLRTNKLALQQYMVIPTSGDFEIEPYPSAEPGLVNMESSSEEVYEKALSWQPSIKSYRLQRQSAEYGLKVAKGSFSPRLNVSGTLNTNYSSASKLTDVNYIRSNQVVGYLQNDSTQVVVSNANTPYTVGRDYPFSQQLSNNLSRSISFTLTVPILNGLQAWNNVQRQKINVENAQLSEKITEVNLCKNVEQSFVDVENAVAKRDATKEQLDAATRSNDNLNNLFLSGKATTTDVLVEKTKFVNAQSQYLQAKYDLIFKWKVLDYYRGIPLNLE